MGNQVEAAGLGDTASPQSTISRSATGPAKTRSSSDTAPANQTENASEKDTENGDVPANAPATCESTSDIVGWDGENDPVNPMNWTMNKKWRNMAVISAFTFLA